MARGRKGWRERLEGEGRREGERARVKEREREKKGMSVSFRLIIYFL